MTLDSASIRDYLADRAGIDTADIGEETALFSSGLIDSFSLIELIAFVEQQGSFRVDAWDVTLDHFDSIARILAYARSRTAEARPA